VGAKTHGDDRLRVVGTEGIVEVTDRKAIIIDADGERELPLGEPENIFSNFVSHIANGTEPIVNAEQTFAVTRASLLARDSADSGDVKVF
jgi:predicted dehydrogenase